MKKKILITMPSMFIGGAERSLLGLLDALDTDRYDVSLFLYRHEGEFMSLIPSSINLRPAVPAYIALDRPIRMLLRDGRLLYGGLRIIAKLMLSIRCMCGRSSPSAFNTMYYISKYLLFLLPRIDGDFDLAINFQGSNDIILDRVSAKIKMGWIHTDYSEYNSFKKLDREMWTQWRALDFIVNVSEECTRIFKECFSFLADKCITIENILPVNIIKEDANALDISCEMPRESGVVCLFSMGRFCYPKNFDSIPRVVSLLNKQGINVKWYLVGFGPDDEVIRHQIMEHSVETQVAILGKKNNPYPYMKACDIYVQPSRFEGKAVSVREAQVLGKPVLITDFATANSQLENGVDGMICQLSIDGIVAGIKMLVKNKDMRCRLGKTAATRDYSNCVEVKKIYALID